MKSTGPSKCAIAEFFRIKIYKRDLDGSGTGMESMMRDDADDSATRMASWWRRSRANFDNGCREDVLFVWFGDKRLICNGEEKQIFPFRSARHLAKYFLRRATMRLISLSDGENTFFLHGFDKCVIIRPIVFDQRSMSWLLERTMASKTKCVYKFQ